MKQSIGEFWAEMIIGTEEQHHKIVNAIENLCDTIKDSPEREQARIRLFRAIRREF